MICRWRLYTLRPIPLPEYASTQYAAVIAIHAFWLIAPSRVRGHALGMLLG